MQLFSSLQFSGQISRLVSATFAASVIASSALIGAATTAQAQSTIPTYAATDGHNLFVYPSGSSTPIQITDNKEIPYDTIYHSAFSPDGQFLVYSSQVIVNRNPDSYRQDLFVVPALGGVSTKIAENVVLGVPITFIGANQVMFMLDRLENRNATSPEDFQYILATATIGGSAPASIVALASLPYGVGCGGGTSILAQMQYNSETLSLGGNGGILAQSAGGVVYSTNCSSTGLNLLPLGGAPVPISPEMARAAVSPDGTRVAGIKVDRTSQAEVTTLLVASTTAGAPNVTAIKTAVQPDQLVWASNDEIYYSTVKDLGMIFTPEELQKFNVSQGMEANSPDYGLTNNRQVTIRRINLTTLVDEELYATDPKPEAADNSYAIGRMQVVNGKLYFSAIDGISGWARAAIDGTLNMMDAASVDQVAAMFPIRVIQLDPTTKGIIDVGQNLNRVTFSPAP